MVCKSKLCSERGEMGNGRFLLGRDGSRGLGKREPAGWGKSRSDWENYASGRKCFKNKPLHIPRFMICERKQSTKFWEQKGTFAGLSIIWLHPNSNLVSPQQMTLLSIIRQKADLNECSAVTWCTACISSLSKHAFYVGEMLWRCMVIFNQVQFDLLFKCNQCWLEIPNGGFEKVKGGNATTILSAHTMSHG